MQQGVKLNKQTTTACGALATDRRTISAHFHNIFYYRTIQLFPDSRSYYKQRKEHKGTRDHKRPFRHKS